MRTQRQGFTFMELLIVTAIIAILAAILFPVFAQAREKSHTSACQHNLKQISIALQLYAYDHYGHFPPTDNDFAPFFPYLREEDVFRCPTAEATESIVLGLPTYAYRGGYTHDDLPNRILVADTQPRHSGGGNLLMLSNCVKWFKGPELRPDGAGPGWMGSSNPERWYVEGGKIVLDEPVWRQ
jgi:prepilin-type N-terminal cleavage/methylation domain-containing protein